MLNSGSGKTIATEQHPDTLPVGYWPAEVSGKIKNAAVSMDLPGESSGLRSSPLSDGAIYQPGTDNFDPKLAIPEQYALVDTHQRKSGYQDIPADRKEQDEEYSGAQRIIIKT